MNNQTLKTSLMQISKFVFFTTLLLLPSTVCGMYRNSEMTRRTSTECKKADFIFFVDRIDNWGKSYTYEDIINKGLLPNKELQKMENRENVEEYVIIGHLVYNNKGKHYEVIDPTVYSQKEAKKLFAQYENIEISTSCALQQLTSIVNPRDIINLKIRDLDLTNCSLKLFENLRFLEINHCSNLDSDLFKSIKTLVNLEELAFVNSVISPSTNREDFTNFESLENLHKISFHYVTDKNLPWPTNPFTKKFDWSQLYNQNLQLRNDLSKNIQSNSCKIVCDNYNGYSGIKKSPK